MSTQPRYMRECNPTEQLQRQELLEALYVKAGRHQRSNPQYGLYTGLFQQHLAEKEAANG